MGLDLMYKKIAAIEFEYSHCLCLGLIDLFGKLFPI